MANNECINGLEIQVLNEELSSSETSESILAKLEMETDDPKRIEGIVVGQIAGVDDTGFPKVDFDLNTSNAPVLALSTIAIDKDAIGREVALMFEQGDPRKPIVMGLMWSPDVKPNSEVLDVRADRKRVEISAEHEIVLRCGEASLTLTKAGKIILRGKYVLSRSSGVNRIKGGSVQIN